MEKPPQQMHSLIKSTTRSNPTTSTLSVQRLPLSVVCMMQDLLDSFFNFLLALFHPTVPFQFTGIGKFHAHSSFKSNGIGSLGTVVTQWLRVVVFGQINTATQWSRVVVLGQINIFDLFFCKWCPIRIHWKFYRFCFRRCHESRWWCC